MRVTYLISWDVNGRVLEHVYEDNYTGDVARLGKSDDNGKSTTSAVDTALVNEMNTEAATKAKQDAALEPQIAQNETTAPGQLSPYSKAQYDSDIHNINDTYDGLKQVGIKNIAQSGMGRAPTGMAASVINTNDRNEGVSETQAYENALIRQQQIQQQAINNRLALAGQQQPAQVGGVAANSANANFGMGTVGGNVASGVATGLGAIKNAQDIWQNG